jgi:hypothetical protein
MKEIPNGRLFIREGTLLLTILVKHYMKKEQLCELLDSMLKDDLVNLCINLSIDNVRGNKNELIERIVDIKSNNMLDLILENSNKNGLINLCKAVEIPYASKNKPELIESLKNLLSDNKLLCSNEEKVINNNSNLYFDVTLENIIKAINETYIPKSYIAYGEETDIQVKLLSKFGEYFGAAQKEYAIGGPYDLKIDIDVADGKFGIELKLFSRLISSSHETTRAIGQAYIYSKRKYNNQNFLFVVYGFEEDKNHSKLKEFEKIIKEFNGHFYFHGIPSVKKIAP